MHLEITPELPTSNNNISFTLKKMVYQNDQLLNKTPCNLIFEHKMV